MSVSSLHGLSGTCLVRYYIMLLWLMCTMLCVRYQTGNNPDTFTNQLVEFDVKRSDDTNELLLNNDLYRIHLDNRVDIPGANLTYDAATDTTTFNMPQSLGEDSIVRFNREVFAYCTIAGAPQQGVLQPVTWNGNVGSLPGDWTSALPNYNIQIGYKFKYEVDITTVLPVCCW